MRGWKKNVGVTARDCIALDDSFQRLVDLVDGAVFLKRYYIESRYPDDIPRGAVSGVGDAAAIASAQQPVAIIGLTDGISTLNPFPRSTDRGLIAMRALSILYSPKSSSACPSHTPALRPRTG